MAENNTAGTTPEEQFRAWMDSQSGYIGKEKKAAWWNDHNQNQGNQTNLDNLFSGERPNFAVSGTAKENAGRIEGLQRARILTGQNPYEIGNDYQEAYGNIKKRANSSDTASELLRANKAGAVADTRNQMQSQGVKGGASAGAVSSVERQKAYDVNNQMIQAEKKAQDDYINAVKSNANFTQASEMNFGAMAAGKDVQAPAGHSNGFGTVICTELYRQGYYSAHVFIADQNYGKKVISERLHVYVGYRAWADKLVPLMQKSERWTEAVAFFAVPWAKNMAGDKNLFGSILGIAGELCCGIIGRIILSYKMTEIKKC